MALGHRVLFVCTCLMIYMVVWDYLFMWPLRAGKGTGYPRMDNWLVERFGWTVYRDMLYNFKVIWKRCFFSIFFTGMIGFLYGAVEETRMINQSTRPRYANWTGSGMVAPAA